MFNIAELWRLPLGYRILERDYILEKVQVPQKWNSIVWAGMVQTAYKRSQDILSKELNSGRSISDYKFLTSRHISLDNLRSKNLKPPQGFTLEEYCGSLNTVYRIGQMFLFKDLENEQIATDEQVALALAADEEEVVKNDTDTDAEIARNLDKNLTLKCQRRNRKALLKRR